MKTMRLFTVLLTLLLLVGAGSQWAHAELRDPFVAKPLGPYTSLNNPASVLEVRSFLLRAALGQGRMGDDTTQLLSYMEPNLGYGAGALYWHGGNLASGSKLREIGYTVARPMNDALFYGLTLKHVREDDTGNWAADIGIMTTDLSRLRFGAVIHNFAGQSVINPTQVTGAMSYDITERAGVSVSLSSPVVSDLDYLEMGLAVDLQAVPGVHLRLGRINNMSTHEGYWMTSAQVDIDNFTIDANLFFAGDDRRLSIGAVYRF